MVLVASSGEPCLAGALDLRSRADYEIGVDVRRFQMVLTSGDGVPLLKRVQRMTRFVTHNVRDR